MIIDNILLYKNGWLVGNFQPALFNANVDIGIIRLDKGHKSDNHYHKLHTEYNVIIEGKAYVNGVLLSKGDIFVYKPMERSKVEFVEDTILLVIKNPSTKNDKYV